MEEFDMANIPNEYISHIKADNKQNLIKKMSNMIRDGEMLKSIKSEINRYRSEYMLEVYSYLDEFKDLVTLYAKHFKGLDPHNFEKNFELLINNKVLHKNSFKVRYYNPISYVLGLFALIYDQDSDTYKILSNKTYDKILKFQTHTQNQVSAVDIYRYARYWNNVLLKN